MNNLPNSGSQADLSQKSVNSHLGNHSGLRAVRYIAKDDQESGCTRWESIVMLGLDRDHARSGNRYTVLIFRLVLDGQARLLYGELLDADAVGQGRFMSLTGLVEAVIRWLEGQQQSCSVERLSGAAEMKGVEQLRGRS
jgi:hypothetical protein